MPIKGEFIAKQFSFKTISLVFKSIGFVSEKKVMIWI